MATGTRNSRGTKKGKEETRLKSEVGREEENGARGKKRGSHTHSGQTRISRQPQVQPGSSLLTVARPALWLGKSDLESEKNRKKSQGLSGFRAKAVSIIQVTRNQQQPLPPLPPFITYHGYVTGFAIFLSFNSHHKTGMIIPHLKVR